MSTFELVTKIVVAQCKFDQETRNFFTFSYFRMIFRLILLHFHFHLVFTKNIAAYKKFNNSKLRI